MADGLSKLSNYAGQAETIGSTARPWGIRERLQSQKDELTARLARVQAALDALDAQPNIEALLEAVFKAL